MNGRILGGRMAATTIKKRYGSDFYQRIGSAGGKNGHTGGFATPCTCKLVKGLHKLANCAGIRGGYAKQRAR